MHIGPWWIPLYTLRVVLGISLSLGWLWCIAPRRGFKRQEVILWLWIILAVAMICGRLGYMIGNLAYFRQNPKSVFEFGKVGGLHGSSTLMGGILIVWIWSHRTKRPFSDTLALLTPLTLGIAAGSWWGCLDIGCAWGQEVSTLQAANTWYITRSPDLYHVILPRYPVQILGMLCAIVMAILAITSGKKGSIGLGLYLLGSTALTLLRADPVPQIGALRIDTLLDATLAYFVILNAIGKQDPLAHPKT